MNLFRSRTAAVVTAAALVVGLGAGTATAGKLVGSKDIAKNAVTSKHIKNGTVKKADLSDGVKKALDRSGTQGPAGPAGPAGADGADAAVNVTTARLTDSTPIDKIGGPINDNNTNLETGFTLQPGTYVVTVSGAFENNTAATTDVNVYPQISLWLDKNKDGAFRWQDGEGDISPNARMSLTQGRHVSVSGTTVITLDAETPVGLLAHGYAEDTSDKRSGEIDVIDAVLTATKIA